MKPYRGTLLAVAVLLATLPLSSCGDADDYAETGGISLTSQGTTMIVKREMIFTVTATFPTPTTTTTTTTTPTTTAAIIQGCDTALEYQAEGAGINHSWRSISGTSATRTFMLEPREVGTLTVIARGKCIGSREDWKYTKQVDVTVTDPTALTKPTVSLEANPATVVKGNPVTYVLGATTPDNCTLRLMYQYSGAGFGVTTVDPAGPGQFILTPGAVGTLSVTATAWCTQNTSAKDTKTTTVTVTEVVLDETITTPATPTAAGGPFAINTDKLFSTTGATSSLGHTLEYEWSATGPATLTPAATVWGGPTRNIQWSAGSATYQVTVRARCVAHPSVISSASAPYSAVIP